LRASFD